MNGNQGGFTVLQKRSTIWGWAFLLAILSFGACGKQGPSSALPASAPVITTAENLKVYDRFDGLEQRLVTDSDTTYVVNFWATWCKPCVAELPHFMQLMEECKDKKVRFLYVSLDFKRQIENKLIPFLESGKLKGEVVVLTDPASAIWIDKVSPEWSGSIPATLIFNKDKRSFHERGFNLEELQEVLAPYLK